MTKDTKKTKIISIMGMACFLGIAAGYASLIRAEVPASEGGSSPVAAQASTAGQQSAETPQSGIENANNGIIIGIVRGIWEKSPALQEAQSKLVAQKKALQDKITSSVEAFQKKFPKGTKSTPAMEAETLALKQLMQTSDNAFSAMVEEMQKNTSKEMQKAANAVCQAKNLAVILDERVLFAFNTAKTIDVTQDVIALMPKTFSSTATEGAAAQ